MSLEKAQRALAMAQKKVDEAQFRLERFVRARDEAQEALEEAQALEDVAAQVDAADFDGASQALARLRNKRKNKREQ